MSHHSPFAAVLFLLLGASLVAGAFCSNRLARLEGRGFIIGWPMAVIWVVMSIWCAVITW